jgi:arsenite methyltransferase
VPALLVAAAAGHANSFGCGNPLADCDVRPGDIILDLGCGAGIDLILAAERVGANGKVIGVDMTDAMVARARENVATTRHENVQVRKGMIEDLPVDTGSVDWVISNCVITLSPEKKRVFSEIYRVLRPRGRMAVSDLVVDDLDGLLASVPWISRTCVGTAMTEPGYLAGRVRSARMTAVKPGD